MVLLLPASATASERDAQRLQVLAVHTRGTGMPKVPSSVLHGTQSQASPRKEEEEEEEEEEKGIPG